MAQNGGKLDLKNQMQYLLPPCKDAVQHLSII